MDTGIFLKNNQKVTKNRISKKDQQIFKNIQKYSKKICDFKSDKYCKFAMDTAILDLIIMFCSFFLINFYIFAMDTIVFFKNIQKVTTK